MQNTWIRRGRGVFLASVAFVVSCGDGGGPTEPGGNNGNPSGTAVTVEQRFASIELAETALESLLASGIVGDQLNETLALALSGVPYFEATGVDTATSMAWARFTDGRLLIIGDNRPAGPVDDSILAAPAVNAAARARSAGVAGATRDVVFEADRTAHAPPRIAADGAVSELPTSPRVRLLHSFGPDFDQLQQPIEDMAEWFEEYGYDVRQIQEGDARIETLRHVSGDGFFYFNTHGGSGLGRSGKKLFAVGTSSLAAPEKDRFPEFRDDLDNDRLVYMTAPNGIVTNEGRQSDTRYAITYHFVEKHWSFAENSIVFLNVCFSAYDHESVETFISTMHGKGAGLYLGWSGVVTATGGFRSARYFVDRLLGANEFQPESPKQRPFTWPLVLEDMASKGYTTDGDAQLVARPALLTGGRVGILRPSIRSVWVAPPFMNSDLYIEGHFGTRRGRVTIDDGSGPLELAIKDWTPEAIMTSLPLTGTGSIGDIVVHVGEHASNPRRLHRYTGTAFYQFTDAGSLVKSAEMELNTRLDPDEMRFLPGETPSRLSSWGAGHASPAAAARYQARGSYTRQSGECTLTSTYYGGGSVPAGTSGTPGYSHALWMDSSGQMAFEIGFGATADHQLQTVCHDGTRTHNSTISIAIDSELRDASWYMLQTTPQMHAIGDSRSAQVRSQVQAGQATVRLSWTDIVPTPAYDPGQAK